MSHLALYLLGPPRLERERKLVAVKRRKVMALLAYLAVTGQPHSREVLATLLSPEFDMGRARNELRRTLSVLNRLLGAGCLAVDRETVALNPDAELWLDVDEFRRPLAACDACAHDHPPDTACAYCVPLLEGAVALYQDDFLAGFTLPDSLEFEEWGFFEREELRDQLARALQRLVRWHDQQEDYEPAIVHARRWLALDPLHEPAHRQLMALYAQASRREAALRQYEVCRQVLADELGMEPAAETTALFQQIQAGVLDVSAPAIHTIRGYQLRERIGSGGFGEVFRAYQPSVGREVAVKVILPQYANQPDFVQRFEREAQLVARLEHPHIVPLYDYWRQRNGAYLVMRWLRGGNLRQSLQRGPWSPEAAAQLLDQLAAALTVAHRQGVVHRDVKPENILLDEEGNAYLSDFGIAKELLRATATTAIGTIPGSLAYIAPEQAQNQVLTPLSDLYSLAVVMHEVLTGAHPFSGVTPADQLVKHLTEPLPPLGDQRPDLPVALDGVIQCATAKDPTERYPDVTAFAQAFREALSTAIGEVVAPMPEPEIPLRLPAFLDEAAQPVGGPRPVFVARERELAQLSHYLNAALAGRGQVVFVTGGSGRGKTALMEEFARRAMDAYPGLLVASGACNAFSGIGDPYLPFRSVLGMLAGDVEARWTVGAITREHACRLWEALPLTAQALLEHGAGLIDIFLPGAALLSRATAAAPEGAGWLERVKEFTEREKAQPGDLVQSQLFEGYTQVLAALATRHPLLLILDDLQWADGASVSLLFHLGRELGGSRVLIMGAYRAEEVALGRPSTSSGGMERHPLEKVLAEFKRGFGDVWLDLTGVDDVEGRRFVEAFLDSEPNRLGADFRGALFQHSGGHPLFTVELLRAMQERGDLIRDEEGHWVQAPKLDWEQLPSRVEAVIAERIARLEEELRDILTIASVEGEEFTAQVLARVGAINERQLLRLLARELEKRHRLVQEQERLALGRLWLSRYRFAHALFQQYLYNDLSQGERALLHREIGEVLEELYVSAGRTEEITAQLARHYAEAGEGEKAVEYALRAGDQARVAYAHEEAIGHYRRALALQKDMGDDDRAARTLMKLGLTHHTAFQFQLARQAFNEAFELRKRATALPPAASLPPAPHPLRLPWEDPFSLDPALAVDTDSGLLVDHLFSGLVELGPELDIVPDLAHSWEMSEGGRRFVFHLRDDVRWNDGTPLTAHDVEYAWKRVLNPTTGSPAADMLHDIKGARAFHHGEVPEPDQVAVHTLDALTLEVELEEPAGFFLHLLAHCATYPVPRHVVERYGGAWAEPDNIITSGPFKLGSWNRGTSILLVRNPAYYARFSGNLQQVELILFPGGLPSAAALETYEADRLDVAPLPEPPEGELARRRHAGEYVSTPGLSTRYVGFDVSRPPFDDLRVRRAFVLAVDRERLADVVLGGLVVPATGGYLPPGMPGHAPGIGLPYDPERAQQLLAEAGYPGGRGFPVLGALVQGRQPVTDPEAVQFAAQWRYTLGVEIEWKGLELDAWLDRMHREPPHIHFGGWEADYPDPDNFLRTSRFRRRTLWQNDAYDRLVEQAKHTTAPGERIKLYQQADAILVQEVPLMPVYHQRFNVLVKPWVSRYRTSAIRPRGYWKDVIIEAHER